MTSNVTPSVARRALILRMHERNPKASAAELARMVGAGCTRNMVIGILNRARERKKVMTTGILAEALGRRLPPHQEPRGCRWIDGDPAQPGWRYCQAKPAVQGCSWCAEHIKRVFRPRDEPAADVIEAAA